MKSTLAKATDGTITLTIPLPKKEVAKTREVLIEEYVKTADLPGFRKGKAPKKLVEEKVDKEKLQEEVLEFLQAESMEELADILEVIDAICEHKNFNKTELEKIKGVKFQEKGGFKKKIILEES
jgi:predicted house-cleaning noncanonical NTP pyrophosphatase (MazG superfamily)